MLYNSLRSSHMNNNYQNHFMLYSNVSDNGELEVISFQSIVTAISKDSTIHIGCKRKFQSRSTNAASYSNSSGISSTTTPRLNLFVSSFLEPIVDVVHSI